MRGFMSTLDHYEDPQEQRIRQLEAENAALRERVAELEAELFKLKLETAICTVTPVEDCYPLTAYRGEGLA